MPRIRIELLTPEEFAKFERTFTPPVRERNFVATVRVEAGGLVVEAADAKLQAHVEQLLATLTAQGPLALPRTHTQEERGGATLSVHRPGERVGIDDERYLLAVEQILGRTCDDPATRFEGRQLVLRYDAD